MSLRLTLLRPVRAPLRPQPLLRRWYADEPDAPVKPKRRPPPPPSAPMEPTTFDGKATPRDVHNRPALRGMPGVMSPWELERQHSRPRSNRAGPRPAPKPKLEEHMFNESAAPRAIYQRPTRDLPVVNSRIGLWIALGVLGLGGWGLFILYATNNERYSSSVVRQVSFQLRNSPEVAQLLGDHVRFSRNYWGFGEPWIAGGINLMQGRIDVKFRMRGDKQEGTVYFTSIRPTQGAGWRIVRYKLVGEYGDTIRLDDKVGRPVLPDEAAADTSNPAADVTLSSPAEVAPVQPTKAVAWIPETRAVAKALLIDLNGTLYVGNAPTPRAVAALERLRDARVPFILCSNNSQQSETRLLSTLGDMGLHASPQELMTSLGACRALVEKRGLSPYLLLSPNALDEFKSLTTRPPAECDAVVIGLHPPGFGYENLNTAFRILKQEPLLPTDSREDMTAASTPAISRNPSPSPGIGRKPVLIAPHRAAFSQGNATDTLPAGLNLGIGPYVAALEYAMRTGKYRPGAEEGSHPPDRVYDSFADYVDAILA
ncbi:uncharacterized protein CcaverHIS019_0212470 [Cutaneotrichosporon cavernicola]|uniref:HAD-superfamily subfamily IIA hydrolase n=1 Tax=Cutaneotrichosporon cavernicola TaxID=279322 RepID=A0AA48L1M2_9TREE|nr:uncharacterized protein CcaverHIS019_0212470 [Cutaneotrichosporon cavernicola]BEI89885.1 hypothetical protein CcaverHIS019_0212470 [Cutaneotrichosporon cavernicola]BEI97656.1 hypothetical protein CcaverHIS631_0212450 [Cutaneotrichosporon cavernicola]